VLDVVLVAPQIANNTGNIIRLCANAGARLHLVEPIGFALDDRSLRRAGLDYHELSETHRWETWDACRAGIGRDRRWFATTAGGARRYDEVDYQPRDVVVFGCEADGLPSEVLAEFTRDARVYIPMRPGNRSINLANAVSIVVYEAWRQQGFAGGGPGTLEEARVTDPYSG
jgi:tRNA (cytidine/uridine-2'-O-)-methyltransferase